MEKYELYKNKDINILRNIVNDHNYSEKDRLIASIIIAERENGYGTEETFNEILCHNRNKRIC